VAVAEAEVAQGEAEAEAAAVRVVAAAGAAGVEAGEEVSAGVLRSRRREAIRAGCSSERHAPCRRSGRSAR
jgi:hypothetical protein